LLLDKKRGVIKTQKNKQTNKKSIILWIYSLCCYYSFFFFNYYFKLFCAILLDRLSSCLIFLCGSDVWLCAIDSLMPSSSLLKELLELSWSSSVIPFPKYLHLFLCFTSHGNGSISCCTRSFVHLVYYQECEAAEFLWSVASRVCSFCSLVLARSFVITAISRFLPCFFRGWLVFQCMFCISDSQPSLKFSLVKRPSVP